MIWKDWSLREAPEEEREKAFETYDDAMAEYDEDAEREAIGDREGGYDPYDNTNW